MHRLVALKWKPADAAPRRRAETLAQTLLQNEAWREHVNWRGVKILLNQHARDRAPTILPAERGIVVGPLFDNQAGVAPAPDAETVDAWCASDLERFARSRWGPYLGVFADHAGDRLLVARGAGGAQPCYWTLADDLGLTIVFTHLEDLARLRPLGEVDIDYVRMFLALPRLVSARTGLCDVREVLGGQCLALERERQRSWMVWRPPCAAPALALEETSALSARLRQGVTETAGAFARLGRPILHRLSGGLDSSIALVGLTQAGGDVLCVSERPLGFEEGDESAAAAAVARALGAQHIIVDYRPDDIDYRRLLQASPALKPSHAMLTFADPHFADLLQSDAMIATSGQGGDQVFARANALAAIGDGVRQRLPLSMLIAIAVDIARASGRSVWPVLKTGLDYGAGRRAQRFIEEVLQRAARADAEAGAEAIAEALSHPWLTPVFRRGPGEIAHALFLADLAYYYAPSLLNELCPNYPVLASAPLMELCCKIPTYAMLRGGRDRALVREAFKTLLPPVALERRRKGDTTRYFAAVAHANRDFVADVLSGGELAALGLRTRARAAPDDVSPDFIAEIWLRQISALRRASAAWHGASPGA